MRDLLLSRSSRNIASRNGRNLPAVTRDQTSFPGSLNLHIWNVVMGQSSKIVVGIVEYEGKKR